MPGFHSVEESKGTELESDHWRLCYFRQERAWRVRRERDGELFLANNYVGDANINWQDSGPHWHHDGPIHIDEEGTAHLIDEDN